MVPEWPFRDVVKQQGLFQLIQSAEPILQMDFQCFLVRQQLIAPTIQSIVIELLFRHAGQIGQRRFRIQLRDSGLFVIEFKSHLMNGRHDIT